MRRLLLIAVISCGCSRQEVVIPDHAVELRVALCPTVLDDEFDTDSFDQELEADPWRLFASEDLTGPLGGLNDETGFGRMISNDVWAVLVVDFENTVCEVYANAESVDPR